MTGEQLTTLTEKIKDEFPEEVKELYESLDLVISAVGSIYDSVTGKVTQLMKEQQLDDAGNYLQHSQTILNYRDFLLEYNSLLENETVLQEEIEALAEDEEKEKAKIPNYLDYVVDETEAHSLYEDFTYTKACGFSFQGQYIEVANMKWVLVETCAILAKIDPKKMESFLTDKSMKGSKISYFGTVSVVENYMVKNEQIPGTRLYVWTLGSCNQLRNLLRAILKKYNIGLDQIKIFLRADYTELHTTSDSQEQRTLIITEEEAPQLKIGKYVQSCFEHLEKTKYEFSREELQLMQSSDWTLRTFGIGKPLIRQYDPTKKMSEQTKIGPYNRYWKQPYFLGDVQYFVICEWLDQHKERFDKWYKTLKIEKGR